VSGDVIVIVIAAVVVIVIAVVVGILTGHEIVQASSTTL
jgi:hypothetical protein